MHPVTCPSWPWGLVLFLFQEQETVQCPGSDMISISREVSLSQDPQHSTCLPTVAFQGQRTWGNGTVSAATDYTYLWVCPQHTQVPTARSVPTGYVSSFVVKFKFVVKVK